MANLPESRGIMRPLRPSGPDFHSNRRCHRSIFTGFAGQGTAGSDAIERRSERDIVRRGDKAGDNLLGPGLVKGDFQLVALIACFQRMSALPPKWYNLVSC